MAEFKRGTLGMITEGMLYLRGCDKGYEVFGKDKLDRKVVLVRRKDLDAAIADGSKAAKMLAGMKKGTIQLDILSERFERFSTEND